MSHSAATRSAKDELRREMRDRREALAPELVREAGERAAAHALALPELASARAVALYGPMRNELPTAPLAAALGARGVMTCYPCMKPGHRRLLFHAVNDQTRLVPNRVGIPQPTEDDPLVETARIDLLVIPGLAFDDRGGRIGWGRAYYDHTLAAAPHALRVGYAFAFQIVPEVPQASGDERVDVLVTEQGIRRTSARAAPRRDS